MHTAVVWTLNVLGGGENLKSWVLAGVLRTLLEDT
jgi:hypothetical protein